MISIAMIHDRQKTCLFPANKLLEANNLFHILDTRYGILSFPKSVQISRHIRQLLQQCSVSDLACLSLTVKQNVLLNLTAIGMYIYIYIYTYRCTFFVCIYMYMILVLARSQGSTSCMVLILASYQLTIAECSWLVSCVTPTQAS